MRTIDDASIVPMEKQQSVRIVQIPITVKPEI